jgi:saccharopine dehydrogenase-like NADP-dependent oxidoreductase
MKILIIGGYGNFGKRLTQSLVEHYNYQLIVAGRSLDKAQKFKQLVNQEYNKKIDILKLDVLSSDLPKMFLKLDLDIVVNASGPFQHQLGDKGYVVARACLLANCHYVDLADDRRFVTGFSEALNSEAKNKGVMLVSGASTVPALTDAVIVHYSNQFSKLESLNYGISPGNRTERGEATIASILSYTGQPFLTLVNGKRQQIIGWQDLKLYDFGSPLGKRWMSNCEIPDLDCLPVKYPELKTIRFQAGLEVTLLHVGLWCLSFLSQMRIVKNWSKYSKILTRMSEWFISWGSDSGGMFVELDGIGLDNEPKKISWQLVAEKGVGPNIPTISAELIIQKIEKGQIKSGAMPCMGLFNLAEFLEVAGRWNIYQNRNV